MDAQRALRGTLLTTETFDDRCREIYRHRSMLTYRPQLQPFLFIVDDDDDDLSA
jgi:hypothetical protein